MISALPRRPPGLQARSAAASPAAAAARAARGWGPRVGAAAAGIGAGLCCHELAGWDWSTPTDSELGRSYDPDQIAAVWCTRTPAVLARAAAIAAELGPLLAAVGWDWM